MNEENMIKFTEKERIEMIDHINNYAFKLTCVSNLCEILENIYIDYIINEVDFENKETNLTFICKNEDNKLLDIYTSNLNTITIDGLYYNDILCITDNNGYMNESLDIIHFVDEKVKNTTYCDEYYYLLQILKEIRE